MEVINKIISKNYKRLNNNNSLNSIKKRGLNSGQIKKIKLKRVIIIINLLLSYLQNL